MDKNELLDKLKKLSKKLDKKKLTSEDVQNESSVLHRWLFIHYDHIADALEDAGLESSNLAKRMRTTNEKLLKNIFELSKKINRVPRHKDIRKYLGHYKIYLTRFGSVKKAYEQAIEKYGIPGKDKKTEDKLPEIDEFKGLFYGSAAEYFIISELLYRGYIAQKMPVDLGLDVYATKGQNIFFFQVKNVSFEHANIRHVSITTSNFIKNERSDVFYIFVILKGTKKECLILNYQKMRELKEEEYIYEENDKTLVMSFKKIGESIFVLKHNGDDNDRKNITKYLGAWGSVV